MTDNLSDVNLLMGEKGPADLLAERCDVLLTLEKGYFRLIPGTAVYGMRALTPRDFLVSQGLG